MLRKALKMNKNDFYQYVNTIEKDVIKMKVILECSHQYINTIKRKLNAHLEQITYLDSFTGNDLSLFIKEVKTLKTLKTLKILKVFQTLILFV